MYFTDLFIRRPVFASVLSLIILIVGLKSLSVLPVRQFPAIEPSVINITTDYFGASANLMEGFVTTPLENALGGIDGIDFIASNSTQGESQITIQFKLGYDINTAIADVTNAVSSVRSTLPQNIQDPVISKKDPNASPTVYISFSSDTMRDEAITDYLLRVVQTQLGTLPGVSQAQIFGTREYAMRLWLDPHRMTALGVTPTDIVNALDFNNVQAAPGILRSPWQQFDVNATTDIRTPEQFDNLVIKKENNYLVRLSDIGRAKLGALDDTVTLNFNGKNKVVVMGIIPQPTANPLNVAKEVNHLLPQIKANAPKELNIKVVWDASKFITASLEEVRETILTACVCVMLVIFIFLGSLRAILIPLVTIPLSLIGVGALMLILGYSINVLTLLAWVLGIGLVVDDAIVVLENIHRHIEGGLAPKEASIIGAREIGFAVIAMTLTLAAVYAPIGFLTDMTGRLFREFSFTLAGAVLVSGFIALTLSPMMCSKLLSRELDKHPFVIQVEKMFHSLMTSYHQLLSLLLENRKIVLIIAGLIYGLCYLLYSGLPHELSPQEDQGIVMAISTGPTAANVWYIQRYSNEIAKIYSSVPEMDGYGIINGIPQTNQAIAFLILKPWDERNRTAQEIIETLFPQLWSIPGLQVFPYNLPSLPGTSGRTPVEFVLKTTGSYDDLNQAQKKLINLVKTENPRLLNLDTNLKLDKPKTTLTIDRNKANLLGINMADIANGLNIFLAQPHNNLFEREGRSYYIVPELYPEFMNYSDQLNNINLKTTSGQLIPISNIAHIQEGVAPQALNHFQQLRATTITASLAPGYTIGDALAYLQNLAKNNLPQNMQVDYSGQSRQYIQAEGGMQSTLIFAIIFIFLVLAAQFESFRDPLVVMVSVPLSITGALIALNLTGSTLNIYTQIGLVTLVGLITKHGILIVEFANQLQKKGLELKAAILEASSLRLRPILMTTGAMLCGALPLALSSGAGAEARKQLGYVIFGGMSFGTLFTLFVVPIVYSYLATRKTPLSTSSRTENTRDEDKGDI